MSAEFETAAKDVKNLKAKPSNDEMLDLYALYKIGTGEDFTQAKQPGGFDFSGKYKYKAWQKEHEAGTSKDDAQKKYVAKVDELKEKYGF